MALARRSTLLEFVRRYSVPQSGYVHHSKTMTIEAEKQSFLWTKTIRVDSLPESMNTSLARAQRHSRGLMNIFNRSLLQAKAFENSLIGSTDPNYSYGFLQNFIRLLHIRDTLAAKEVHYSWDTKVASTFFRGDTLYALREYIDLMISSKHPLQAHFPDSVVQESIVREIPSTLPIYPTIDLTLQKDVKMKHETGISLSSSFPHLHTAIILYQNALKDIYIIQKGICTTFSKLYAEAKLKMADGSSGVLDQPLSGQCIVTNGKTFTFFYYQLNTIDMNSDDGVKNLVHIAGPISMYKKLSNLSRHKSIIDLNGEGVNLLVATLTN